MNLLTQMIEATECREIDRIIEQNLFKVSPNSRSFLSQFANRSKRRIQRVNQEKQRSFKVYEKN